METEFLHDRKRALEEEFFRKQDAQLVERLRSARARQTAKQALAEASGIADDATLERLVDLGVDAQAFLALELVPLVEVAWASGRIEPPEREAILARLRDKGLAPGSVPHTLVEGWLATPPAPAMLEAWTAYTGALCRTMPATERERLRTTVMGLARGVAAAAGGVLGVGKVSAAEEEMLRRLDAVFAA
jgi:hypothetical protein